MKFSPPSGRAGWARYIARAIRGWIAWWQLWFCQMDSRPTRIAWPDSRAKPKHWSKARRPVGWRVRGAVRLGNSDAPRQRIETRDHAVHLSSQEDSAGLPALPRVVLELRVHQADR